MTTVKNIWKIFMVENETSIQRPRGRPSVRPDEETREMIIAAAETQFCGFGFEAANINVIAKNSGVSTKTLYRLFPTKADLFSCVVTYRTKEFARSVDHGELRSPDMRAGLVRLLASYGNFVLSPVVLAITRLVIAEAERFPEITKVFWEQAVQRTNKALNLWLEEQVRQGRLAVSDTDTAAGMLRGMMVMEPQRAFLMKQGVSLDSAAIQSRAEACADIFLNGATRTSG